MSAATILIADDSPVNLTLLETTLVRPMHDVGKIGIPDHILLKPGKLTAEEFEVMKTHPQKGADLLAGLDSCLPEILEIHNEYRD